MTDTILSVFILLVCLWLQTVVQSYLLPKFECQKEN